MHCRPSVWVCSGVTCLVVGISSFFWFPPLVTQLINGQLQLAGTDSAVYDMWENATSPLDKKKWGDGVEIYSKYYVFACLNAEDVMQHGAKPKMVSHGPYVYREYQWKVAPEWSADKSTLQYGYHDRLVFDAAKSGKLKPTDSYTVVNLAMIGLLDRVRTMPAAIQEIASGFIKETDKMFVNKTVDEIIFGFDDPTLRAIRELLPTVVPTSWITLIINDDPANWQSLSKMETGVGDITQLYNIVQWAGFIELKWWNTAEANTIRGTDGSQFHPYIKDTDKLVAFVDDLYRSVTLVYDSDQKYPATGSSQVQLKRFKLDPEDLMSYHEKPSNAAFNQMGHSGTFNISCVPLSPNYNAPTFISLPYFVGADPYYTSLLKDFPKVDPTQYNIFLSIEPTLGVVLSAHKKFQVNVAMRQDKNIHIAKNLPPLTYVPVMWSEESMDAPDKLVGFVRSSLHMRTAAKVVGVVVGVLLTVGGVVLSALGAYHWRKEAGESQPLLPETERPGIQQGV